MNERLKERLIGAVVLVVAAVIFVPLLLAPPEQPPVEVPAVAAGDSDASKSSDGSFISKIRPLQPPPKVALTQVPQEAPANRAPAMAAKPSGLPAPATPLGKPVTPKPAKTASATPKNATVPVPKKGTAEASGRGDWVVQLASFAKRENAIALRDRLRKKGFKTFVKAVQGTGGKVVRVFVGPQQQRAIAKSAVEALERETKLRGIVVRFPAS